MSSFPPREMLTGLAANEEAETQKWWASLSCSEREYLNTTYQPDEIMPTFSINLVDEIDATVHDDAGDRYEYLVNHEHAPIGLTLGNRTIPLPAISLLSPNWPPYSVDSRFDSWELTSSLYSQLKDEFDRFNLGASRNGHSGLDSKTMSSLWNVEQQHKKQHNQRMNRSADWS